LIAFMAASLGQLAQDSPEQRELQARPNIDTEDEFEASEDRETAVYTLARKFTAQSQQFHHESPFTAEKNSNLDPSSSNFKPRDWAKAFYNARYTATTGTSRHAGFAFRDLSVWGHGYPTDFQMSVGNAVLKLPSLLKRASRRLDILRSFDGLVLPGEQLCVLGPPG
jgi:ATP-binding cassette, subfamily G (WHITE), member 2, PDR